MQLNTVLKKDFQIKLQLLQQLLSRLFVVELPQELSQLQQIVIPTKLFQDLSMLEINT
jgi:hypothetical protein